MDSEPKRYEIIRYANEEELKPLIEAGVSPLKPNQKAWVFKFWASSHPPTRVAIYDNKRGEYDVYNLHDGRLMGQALKTGLLGKEIEEWDFKHNLSANTLKTFEEIIDEL